MDPSRGPPCGIAAAQTVTAASMSSSHPRNHFAPSRMTGRFITAQRALATGLVSEVVPDDQLDAAAEQLVQEMLAASPRGLRMTKEGLSLAIDAPSLEAAMAIENRNQLMTSASPNVAEGMRAFLEKRPPNYIRD